MLLKFFISIFLLALVGCGDIQPKVVSIPDEIGNFIFNRYPALLADPETEPEIYNSAVIDYETYEDYNSLYGSSNIDDYILYSSINDYNLNRSEVIKKKKEEIKQSLVINESDEEDEKDFLTIPDYKKDVDFVIVKKGDTIFSLSKKHKKSVKDLININNLKSPYLLSIGQKIKLVDIKNFTKKNEIENIKEIKQIKPEIIKPAVVSKKQLIEIKVENKETLYSLSRKYSIPVNELAVINKLSPPFILIPGQVLKVPKISSADKQTDTIKVIDKNKMSKFVYAPKIAIHKENKYNKEHKKEVKKISSDPKQKLPIIANRSSNLFSWPLRGKILSAYGIKSNGLFNDGINISGNIGTKVSSSENGVIAYAGNELKGMGNLIIIQHSGGWMTVYAHLETMEVRRGVKVKVGDRIGTVGKTGKVSSPQLHFEIRKGSKAYDPYKYLKR